MSSRRSILQKRRLTDINIVHLEQHQKVIEGDLRPILRRRRKLLWIGCKYVWLIVDVLIIVLFFTRGWVRDSGETAILLTANWNGPLGLIILYLYAEVTSPYLHWGPVGEVVGTWLVSSIAGYLQYFVLLPALWRRYVKWAGRRSRAELVAGHPEGLHGLAAMTPEGGRPWLRFALVAVPNVAAWWLAGFTPASLLEAMPPERWEPKLPAVSVPFAAGSDVISLVPSLFSALGVAALCCLIVEATKLFLVYRYGRAGTVPCLMLLLLQLALALDTLRLRVPDWYGYGLHFARLVQLRWERPLPDVVPVPGPWLSFAVLSASLLAVGRCTWRRPAP